MTEKESKKKEITIPLDSKNKENLVQISTKIELMKREINNIVTTIINFQNIEIDKNTEVRISDDMSSIIIKK